MMTKARTEGQKRGRPRLEGIIRQPNGQPSRMSKATIEANQSVALLARARHSMTAEAICVEMGEAMQRLGGKDERKARAEAVRKAVERQEAVFARMAHPEPRMAVVEPDMSEPDPKKREKKFARARQAAEMKYQAEMTRFRADMRNQKMGCAAGRAILGEEDEAALWGAIEYIRRVYRAYWMLSGIPMPWAKGASMEVLPDSLGSEGVEASGGADLRTHEDRLTAATSSMMRIEGALATVGATAAVKLSVLSMREDDTVKDRPLFLAGLRAVAAPT